MKHERFVIIGASLAGASAAAALREGGFDGTVELIGAESQLPYNRPPLSKGYLRGQERFEDQLVNPADYYTQHDIKLRLGVRVTRVDPGRKVVGLDGYDLRIVEQIPIIAPPQEERERYMAAKRDKLGHLLPMGGHSAAGAK